jgi:hypothetical protein
VRNREAVEADVNAAEAQLDLMRKRMFELRDAEQKQWLKLATLRAQAAGEDRLPVPPPGAYATRYDNPAEAPRVWQNTYHEPHPDAHRVWEADPDRPGHGRWVATE